MHAVLGYRGKAYRIVYLSIVTKIITESPAPAGFYSPGANQRDKTSRLSLSLPLLPCVYTSIDQQTEAAAAATTTTEASQSRARPSTE